MGLLLATNAEEAAHQVLTAVSSSTLSGYVSTSAIWKPGVPQTNPPVPCLGLVSFTNGHAFVPILVNAGRTNRLEVSTNLTTWILVMVFVAPIGSLTNVPLILVHSNAVNLPQMYYRVIEGTNAAPTLP
jgi:hypothetical protein